MAEIEIIGAVAGEPYPPEAIQTTLAEGMHKGMTHGEAFTGRPGTRILVCDRQVIKLRTEIHPLTIKDARRFATESLERERRLGLAHPRKTWFLLFDESDAPPTIANITPRLRPLHQLEELGGAHCGMICRMIDDYLEAAATHDVGLDISLSNFALDDEGRLFYLDDDLYAWDDFHALTQFLGILVRSLDLGDEALGRIATQVRHSVVRHFASIHKVYVIAEDARGLFMPPEKREIMARFLRTLNEDRQVSDWFTVTAALPSTQPKPCAEAPTGEPAVETEAAASAVPPIIAILADIHANAPALRAVLARLDELGVVQGVVLGDVLGYGPHPKECLALLRERPELRLVLGNHDSAVITGAYSMGFSSLGRQVIQWTASIMSDEEKQWLNQQPLYLLSDTWMAVHGSPTDHSFFNAYVYEMTYEDNLDNLAGRGLQCCFHGHTHLPKVYYRKGRRDAETTEPVFSLEGVDHALVCPGSVGQPRSGIPGAEFALYDLAARTIQFHRIPYDLEQTLADMRRHQLPGQLIQRLMEGR